MTARLSFFAALFCCATAFSAIESTSITFTRGQVAQMAALWETDTIAISPLTNAQYPVYTATWQYIFPHTNISADGDLHVDMAVDNAGAGATGNNTGASPIVGEVINTATSQLTHLGSLSAARATVRGIFRFYTEHASERHFELHPATELDTWNGSGFVLETDYRDNIVAVPDGTNHTSTTLTRVIDGSQTVSATIKSDNNKVDFVFPSPSVNYVQYAGVALSAVTVDATSSYFLFRPNLLPSTTLRCRLVANTNAAYAAAGLRVNQSVTVNALTRTDMGFVSNQIAPLTAGQSAIFPRQVELIVLGLPGFTPPLQLVSAVSAKAHGVAGSFNLDLPITGNSGIEGRSGGTSNAHTIVFTFDNPLVSGNASVTSGTASIFGSPAISGNTMTVSLTGVTDAQTVSVLLTNVTDTSSQVLPNTAFSASFLLGDTNGDGFVNAGDALQTRNRSGQATDATNFRSDVNTDGSVNSGDSSIVRSRSGTGLSGPSQKENVP